MTLALPVDIANHADAAATVTSILTSLPGPVTYHVCAGRSTANPIGASEYTAVSRSLAECSIICVLDGTRGLREPIAGFIANKSLGSAKLQHLIDDRPPASNGMVPRRTMEMLGVYIRYLFADHEWLNRVTVPSNVQLLDGLFDLSVLGDDVSSVTLKDIGHRPKSARIVG